MFRLQHIDYLPGLIAVPFLIFLFIFLLQWKKIVARRIGEDFLVKQLVKNYSPLKYLVKFIIVLIAFTSIFIGLANPQKKGAAENSNRRGVDIVLVLDVSKSMLAQDVRPNRLEKAKQFLIRLLDNLQNDRVGLVLFAGRAYMQMPLTLDQTASKMYIQDASPDIVPTQGTVIADALKMANTCFNNKERKYKAIVLVSDGEDHNPDALQVAKQLADEGVMINVVGIGSPEGSPIIDPATRETKKDVNGQVVISKLNETELKQLADATNGIYLRLDNMDDALITLSQRLDAIEKRSLNGTEFIHYQSFFQWFLAAALLLLLTEFLFPERKFKMA